MGEASSKKGRREQQARRKNAARWNRLGLVAGALGVVVASGGWFAWQEVWRPGNAVESQGRTHVPEGTVWGYNSRPPTSGPHANPTQWGEHLAEIPEVNQVHNLEHGGILIQYNCQVAALQANCDDARQQLRAILQTARDAIDRKVILAPYTRMDRPIALTAWTRSEYLPRPNQEAILRFIRGNINRAPEELE